MPNIIDVILHKNAYGTQTMFVLDKMPEFKYKEFKTKRGTRALLSKDGIFSSLYYYDRPTKNFQAFAGRKFDIPMEDGSIIEASGQWWDGSPENTTSVGISTIEKLEECYVFFSSNVEEDKFKQITENWNKPSNNYHKYDKRDKSYQVHTIESPWD